MCHNFMSRICYITLSPNIMFVLVKLLCNIVTKNYTGACVRATGKTNSTIMSLMVTVIRDLPDARGYSSLWSPQTYLAPAADQFYM